MVVSVCLADKMFRFQFILAKDLLSGAIDNLNYFSTAQSIIEVANRVNTAHDSPADDMANNFDGKHNVIRQFQNPFIPIITIIQK